MDRITKIYPNGKVTVNAAPSGIDQTVVDTEINNSEPITAAIRRLAELENEIEQGLRPLLPCKVGDTVWVAYPETKDKSGIYPCKVQSIYLTDDNNFKTKSHLNIRSHISIFTKRMNLSEIGKTVFLTPESAEKAVKERDIK